MRGAYYSEDEVNKPKERFRLSIQITNVDNSFTRTIYHTEFFNEEVVTKFAKVIIQLFEIFREKYLK